MVYGIVVSYFQWIAFNCKEPEVVLIKNSHFLNCFYWSNKGLLRFERFSPTEQSVANRSCNDIDWYSKFPFLRANTFEPKNLLFFRSSSAPVHTPCDSAESDRSSPDPNDRSQPFEGSSQKAIKSNWSVRFGRKCIVRYREPLSNWKFQ